MSARLVKKKVAIIFGLGGGWLDPKGGEVYLLARCKAAGFIVPNSPFNYNESQAVHDFLIDADWCAIIGDSFGADFGPQYAAELAPKKVNYLAGFQPSVYAQGVRNNNIVIPANVLVAHCIRDPHWIDTGGLGYASYVAADPRQTKLLVTEHRGAHPDDYGYSQDLVFAELKALAEKAT